jgi:hypothetical protein
MRENAIHTGLVLLLASQLSVEKRPLNHADYDGWKHIQNQQLSSDGRYLAYAVFPQEGNGELILRDLRTGKETRQPVGELPPPPRPNYANPIRGRALLIAFCRLCKQWSSRASWRRGDWDSGTQLGRLPDRVHGIFMVDRVNTPLLMIHNDADDAVPWYQGIEHYLR